MADEERHTQRERVLASRHDGHVDVAPQQGALHRFVVGVAQEPDRRPTCLERLAYLFGEVAGTHQEHAHGPDDIQVWRDLRARRVH